MLAHSHGVTSRTTKCLVIADGARARILTFSAPAPDDRLVGARPRLREVRDLVNPGHRVRNSDALTDTRPGLRQSAQAGVRHGVDDHRDSRRLEEGRRFASEIAHEVGSVGRRLGPCSVLVFAAPHLLGQLRTALARVPEWGRDLWPEWEQARDLTHFTVPDLHKWMIASDHLPA